MLRVPDPGRPALADGGREVEDCVFGLQNGIHAGAAVIDQCPAHRDRPPVQRRRATEAVRAIRHAYEGPACPALRATVTAVNTEIPAWLTPLTRR